MFTAIHSRRPFEEAVVQIAQAVLIGDLDVGGRLPSERELSLQMGISRPTVREALRLLAERGIVEVRTGARGGTYVVDDLVPGDLVPRPTLTTAEVASLLEARRLVEPRVAQLASLRGSERDFEAMRDTLERQRRAGRNRERSRQLDFRFHMQLARATRNPTVVELMRGLLWQLEAARGQVLRGKNEPARAVELHEQTLEAILGGDPEIVDRKMDEHLGFLEEVWESKSGRRRLRRPPDFLLPYDERRKSKPRRRTSRGEARP